MGQLAPGLEQKIATNPEAPFNVIVRVDGDLDARQRQLQATGFQIRRKLGLIKGFAATASGSHIRNLSAQPWVTSIDEDQQVHTLDQ